MGHRGWGVLKPGVFSYTLSPDRADPAGLGASGPDGPSDVRNLPDGQLPHTLTGQPHTDGEELQDE